MPPDGTKTTFLLPAWARLRALRHSFIAGRHFVERFAPYLPDGPLPEYFLPGKGQPSDPTGSHGWAVVPLAWLHDTVLGIRPAMPGGKVIHWNPVFVGWRKVRAIVATPFGPCEVRLDWTHKKFDIAPPVGISVVCGSRSLKSRITG